MYSGGAPRVLFCRMSTEWDREKVTKHIRFRRNLHARIHLRLSSLGWVYIHTHTHTFSPVCLSVSWPGSFIRLNTYFGRRLDGWYIYDDLAKPHLGPLIFNVKAIVLDVNQIRAFTRLKRSSHLYPMLISCSFLYYPFFLRYELHSTWD